MEVVEASKADIGVKPACEALGLSRATYYRHKAPPAEAKPWGAATSPRALKAEERKQVLDLMHSERFMDQAPREIFATLLDECWGLGPRRDLWESALPFCDVALPSASDLSAIYPGDTPDGMADRILEAGAGSVCLKLGAAGCLIATASRRARLPALPARVADVTGAGDCWDAGFLAGLMTGEEMEQAARLGAACAAFCIESMGATAGVPRLDAVRARAGL